MIDGNLYRGWVSDIFKSYLRRAEAEGRRLPEGWEDRVWQILAKSYPAYIECIPDQKHTVTVSIATILSFVKFVRRRGFNRSVVSTQVAEARAAICRECPHAAIMVGCPKCKASVREVVGSPKVELDFGERYGKKVEACKACGCYLDVKAWMPARFLLPEAGEFEWWEECWMLRLQDSGAFDSASPEAS